MVAFPPSPQRIQTLEALRAQIERLERGAARSSGAEGPVHPGNPAGSGDPRCETSGVEAPPGAPRGATAPATDVGLPPTDGVLPPTDVVPTGWPSVDAWLPGGVPRGLVTEWFGLPEEAGLPEEGPAAGGPRVPEPPTASSKAGSPMAERTKARASKTGGAPSDAWTPPLSLLVHLAHQVLSAPLAGAAGEGHGSGRTGPVLWIGRRVWPYGRALVRAGPKGARLLARSLFVAMPDDVAGPRGRRASEGVASEAVKSEMGARLWALDLALRCRAVAAVVADGRGFAMAASRRLQVAAEAGHAFVVLARPPDEFDVPSAAAVRFVVTRTAIDADARPGAPRSCAWSLTLRRAKGAAARTRASVVSPSATSPPSPSSPFPSLSSPSLSSPSLSSPSLSLRDSSLRTALGPEGPAVVLVWDAVHGVIEQGTVPAAAGGGERFHPGARDPAEEWGHAGEWGHAATDPGVVPAVVLDRPLAATTHASGSGDVLPDAGRPDAGRPEAGRPETGRPAEARRRRRTRARR